MQKEIIVWKKSVFELSDYQDSTLQPDEIRGQTVCTLISPGTELNWAESAELPLRPGYAAVFKVTEIGSKVTDIAIGEMRFCMGCHRSTQQHPAKYTLPLPKGVDAKTAVLARLMGVSMTTFVTTQAKPGDKVVIAGAGPVGFLAAHLFNIALYDVSVVDPNPLRRAQLEKSGSFKTYAKMPFDDDSLLSKVALFIDCSGCESAVLDGCKIVRKNGEVVLVGVPWKQMTDISAHKILHAVFMNLVTLKSGWEWSLPIDKKDFAWEQLLEGYNNSAHSIFSGFARSLQWIAHKSINLDGAIHIASPHSPNDLYNDIRTQNIKHPFIVLDWHSYMQSHTL